MSYNTEITASTTGASSAVVLPEGDYRIFVKTTGAFSVTLQISDDNSTWVDLQDSGSAATFSANGYTEQKGGMYLRGNVASLTNPITIIAKKIRD